MMIAVEECATKNPMNSETLELNPAATITSQTTPVVRMSWSPPPISTIFFIESRFFSGISNPMVNISRITPSSASRDT